MNIEEVFRKLRPVMGEKLDILWQEYLISDPETRQLIEKTLRVTLARRFREAFDSELVLLQPPPDDVARGEYPLGIIHYGQDKFYPFGLRENEFIQHIGIFGRSGSGKTNVAYLILLNLIRAGKPFLVFDWKRNYRDLLVLPECRDVLVFTIGRGIAGFRFNPLIPPPGTPATVWLKKLIEIMCHAYFLGEGVAVLLMRAIDALYRTNAIYGGNAVQWPTMRDVRHWLAAYRAKGREMGWMESAMRAVEVLCFGEVGSVLNSGASFDIERLLERRVILELDALTNSDKTFLIEALLLWVHHFRMAQTERERFKHAIILEEAHHVLLRKKQEVTGEETVTDVILREIRELGEAIILLDQHPSLISKPALGNTYATFAMNLKHRGDIAMVKDCLLLDSEQAGYLGKLEVGWAVTKLQGRWFKPFLVRFPLLTLVKGSVTDDVLRNRMVKAQEPENTPHGIQEGISTGISPQEALSGRLVVSDREIWPIPDSGKKEKKKVECAIDLTTKERKFLEDVLRCETSSITDRYHRLGFSSRFGNSVQNSLLLKGLLSSTLVSFGNSRIKAVSVTEKGRTMLGKDNRQSERHGGVEHQYWKERVATRLRELGYKVEQEVPVGGGKTVDLVATCNGRKCAIEIETGKSDAAANVRKCIESGFDLILSVATTLEAKKAIERQVASVIGQRKNVRLLAAREMLDADRLD